MLSDISAVHHINEMTLGSVIRLLLSCHNFVGSP